MIEIGNKVIILAAKFPEYMLSDHKFRGKNRISVRKRYRRFVNAGTETSSDDCCRDNSRVTHEAGVYGTDRDRSRLHKMYPLALPGMGEGRVSVGIELQQPQDQARHQSALRQ